MITYYVVQSFSVDRKRRLQADPPIQARDESHAKRMAMKLAETKVGVVAFSRKGDPQTGDYEDAILIHRDGGVPEAMAEELDTMQTAEAA